MKTIIVATFALAALVVGASAQGLRAGDVKIDKITPSLVKTPEYNITGGQAKRFKTAEWLEVEVEFTTIPEIIDELTFNYKIMINRQLLVGDVTHIEIPKGREHYSVAYVAPRGLESVNKGKSTFNMAAVEGIWIEVSKQGQVIAKDQTAKIALPNLPTVQGRVLSKSQTPFALLYWDRYEALKPLR